MGCDFNWSATEEDTFRQRKAGWFVESLITGMEPSSFMNDTEELKWVHQTFNGYYSGYFIHLKRPNEIIEFNKLFLIGTTFYFPGMDTAFEDNPFELAKRQFSFVFNNTSFDPPELITLETISETTDLSKPKYEWVRDYFYEARRKDPAALKGVFCQGGYERMIAGASWLGTLLYSIKKQFLPNLEASDDSCIFESLAEDATPILPEFGELIYKPSLAEKWGFGDPVHLA